MGKIRECQIQQKVKTNGQEGVEFPSPTKKEASMAQKGCLHKIIELLADCKTDAVITLGDGELCGYIITPTCFVPIGKELGIYIQLERWTPLQSLLH